MTDARDSIFCRVTAFLDSHQYVILLASVWVCCTILTDRTHDINQTIDILSRIDCSVIEGATVLCATYILAKKAIAYLASNPAQEIRTVSLPAAFSVAQAFGPNVEAYEQLLNPTLSRLGNILDLTFCLIGWFLLFWIACNVVLRFMLKLTRQPRRRFEPLANALFCGKRAFVVPFLTLFALWLPSFLLLFPGVVTWDTYYQINMGLGNNVLSDHHPYLISLLIGAMLDFATPLAGSTYAAISFVTVAQMLLLSATIAFCISTIQSNNAKLVLLALYGLNPLVAWYSATLWKDVLHSAFLLLVGVLLWNVANGKDLSNRRYKLIALCIACLLVMLTKKSGIYILLLAFAVCMLSQKRARKALAASFSAAFLLFFFAQYVGFNVLGVEHSRQSEALSVPLQQIARTVTHHADELDPGTVALIDSVLPYDSIGELYYPKCSDNIKSNLDEEAFASKREECLQTYLNLGFRYPFDYLESFLCGTCGYWYPETKYWFISSSDYLDILNMYSEKGWAIHDPDYANYDYLASQSKRMDYKDFVESIRAVPGVSLLFSIGAWVWVYALLGYASWKLRMKRLYPVLSVALGIWIVCLISPVYAEMRYALALLLLLPMASLYFLSELRALRQPPYSKS